MDPICAVEHPKEIGAAVRGSLTGAVTDGRIGRYCGEE